MEEQPELSKRERKKLNREKKREAQEKSEQQSDLVKKVLFIGLVVLAAAFIWNSLQNSSSSGNLETEQNQIISNSEVRATDHVKGNSEAQLIMIEYGDFQCPACAGYFPLIKQIEEKYSDQIAIVYRQFPLRSIHKNAQTAAQATEAAAKQDKFWEMHDILFERQDSWSDVRDPRSDFISYAKEIGLDEDQFASDMNSDEVKSIVDQSFNEAVTLGINSTPTFILNGEKLSLAPSFAAFEEAINEALSNLPQDDDIMMEDQTSESADIEEQL